MPTAISAAPSSLSSSKCSTSGRRQAVAAPRAPCRRHAGRGAHRLAATYRVDLDINGTLHVLDVDENDTILQTAMDAGLEVPHDCRMGVCLRCASRITEGDVDQSGGMISDEAADKGYALLCVSYPQSAASVKIIPEEELMDEVMMTAAAKNAAAKNA